jgi:hypothetical protein
METYEVPDLQLAAWLVAIGAPFPETARSVRGRAVFVFANTEGQIAWDAEKYRLGCDEDCSVNVRHLWRAYDALKKSLGPKEIRR